MFIKLAALFFMLAFAGQTFNRVVIVMDYYANTGAFAKNCENKARPQLHCNGQCQLMKKLKQVEKKDAQNPERKAESKNEVISSRSYFPAASDIPVLNDVCFAPLLSSGELTDRSFPIFHPPSLV